MGVMRNLLLALALLVAGAVTCSAQIVGINYGQLPKYATPPTCATGLAGFQYFDTDDNTAKLCDGTSYVTTSTGITVGTLNAIPKFTATDLADSSITDSGTVVDLTVADIAFANNSAITSDTIASWTFTTPTANTSILNFITTLPITGVGQTTNFVSITPTNADHTGGTVNAFNIGAITGDAEATENGLYINSGYDSGINLTAIAASNTIAPIFLADAARLKWNGQAVLQVSTGAGNNVSLVDASGNILWAVGQSTIPGGTRIGTAVAVVGAAQALSPTGEVFHVSAGAAADVATIVDPVATLAARITIICNDANLTFTNADAGGANTIDLVASFVCSANDTLELVYDATNDRWLETGRSVN